VHQPLEEALMQQAGAHLLGEHDFSAFRSSECQSHSSVRELQAVAVGRHGDWVHIDVTANAFLHHMVRNIVGLLLAIGMKRVPPERARQQIEGRERSRGEATAAAHGLYLWRVDYPPEFGLPADSAIMEPHVVV
jgi:tRNA pseudouridine38-40 synthase